MQYYVNFVRSYLLLALLLVANSDTPVRVLSQLNRFDKVPDLVLPRLAAPTQNVDIHKLGRPAVLIFGEPYHQQTLGVLAVLKKKYDTIGLTDADLNIFLIFSQMPTQEQMAQLQGKEMVKADILLDKNLKAFGDYGITVLPSTVVIDKEGRIDLALSGFPLTFADMVEDAILLATGHITREQLESSVTPAQQDDTEQKSVKRAHRLTSLAGNLARRGYTQLALERYHEALELDGTYIEAKIGTARCLVKLNLLPDAVGQLQTVLLADPNHVEANLVMSQIEITQGGAGIAEGKMRLQRILTANPDHPEANYLMGTVCETQGETDHALNYYKKAAKRLLETAVN